MSCQELGPLLAEHNRLINPVGNRDMEINLSKSNVYRACKLAYGLSYFGCLLTVFWFLNVGLII